MKRISTRRDPFLRFVEKVSFDLDGCWRWIGQTNENGYAKFSLQGVHQYAHRWIYVQLVGDIPIGNEVDHLCFERGCVNPDHLECVPKSINARRTRSALSAFCSHGHPFTDETTYIRPDNGRRQCRTCAHLRYLRRKNRDQLAPVA